VKVKLAVVSLVGSAGPAVIDVLGAAVSTVHVNVAGLASVLPTPRWACGLVQAVKAPASSLHSKVLPVSVDVNEKLAVVALVGVAGLEVIAVSGAVPSTVHVWVAGVGSVFPAGSVARTSNVCVRSTSPL
jgi:hypothetical protein